MKKATDDQLHALVETIERLRKEQYSHLSEGLVRELLEIHADLGAAEADYGRAAEQAIERYLSGEAPNAAN